LQIKGLIKRYNKQAIIFVFFVTLIGVYYLFDPTKSPFFLKCPLKMITGYDCAGCGIQRSFHSLLHFRLLEAFKFNPLFVISIPFLILALLLYLFNKNDKLSVKLDNYVFNKKIIVFVLIIIFVFSLLRNSDYYKAIIEYL